MVAVGRAEVVAADEVAAGAAGLAVHLGDSFSDLADPWGNVAIGRSQLMKLWTVTLKMSMVFTLNNTNYHGSLQS